MEQRPLEHAEAVQLVKVLKTLTAGALPCTTRPGGGPCMGHSPLLAIGAEPLGGVTAALHAADEACSQRPMAADRGHHAPSQTGTLSTVPPSQPAAGVVGPAPAAVLNITLRNASNHCYANALVTALLWAAAHVEGGWRVADIALSRLLRWVARDRPDTRGPVAFMGSRSGVELWVLRGWRDIVQHWQDPHRQQDVGEFLQHLAPRIADRLESQEWQSRTQTTTDPTPQTQVSDQGTLWPLVLAVFLPELQALHSTPLSLQQLLIARRNQAARHAILEAPELLAIQVNRFSPDGSKVVAPRCMCFSLVGRVYTQPQ